MNEGRLTAPQRKDHILFQGDRRYGAAVNRLLTIAAVAGLWINDPCLVIPEFVNFGAEFSAEPASDTGIHVNFRCHHDNLLSTG